METKRFIRVTTGVLALMISALLSSTAWAAPQVTAATPPQYVALGDSYAAGNAAGSYISDGTDCHRSLKAYPGLVASANGYALDLQACSGAVVSDVANYQLGTLSAATAKVTITVGGNDVGFADTLTTCVGTNTTACLNAIAVANDKATNELPPKLASLFATVKSKAPNARIVVTDYPRLFNGKDCSLVTSFTASEMTALNAGSDRLAQVIQTAASNAGVGFVDVRGPFVKHAVCDSSAWIKNVQIFSLWESFHPNANGHLYGYKPGVLSALGTSASGTTMTVKVGGQTSSDTTRGTVRIQG